MQSLLLEKTQSHIEESFRIINSSRMYYHNLEHTKDVVEAVKVVGQACELSDDQLETALIAAWFHDIGYSQGDEAHEKKSINMAVDFLSAHHYKTENVVAVIGCILATKVPQQPKNIVEQVVCDADLAHLAIEQYFEKAENLRKELSESNGVEITEETWLMKSRSFFNRHQYFTPYGKRVLQSGKKKNYDEIRARLNNLLKK